MANSWAKNNKQFEKGNFSDKDGRGQLLVNGVSAVFYGNDTSALDMRNYGDGFAAVATEREKERVKLFIIGFDLFDCVFLPFEGLCKVHESAAFQDWKEG